MRSERAVRYEGNMESEQISDYRQLSSKLYKEYRLLHLVWHRNKNQHRSALWWRRFSMLKRNCAQVVELLSKKKLRKDSDIIRLYKVLDDLHSRQVSKTYCDFNGVIALGQFVTLGVILVGLLSRIYGIYGELMSIFEEKFQKLGCLDGPGIQKTKQDDVLPIDNVLGFKLEDFGEEITIESSEAVQKVPKKLSEEKPAVKPTKKKKKKKSKSAIDDIFG
ncbi:Rmp1p TDEL_0F04770 [Torulaspora delbrueckii]|uniref:RNase MRP protein 1 RNA binding domain-containing protein n=1 Tax=Torulaspora delbrueckii TaxID=4950 RepID=G8ZXE4_TORDE|nr:hypothetical protein TDEL_0F04770 [Torulaspora delbrueckii]CCE93288.1 hypothetical protein TDEL_0F04770 [Torulaspora delbrueckii]